MKIILLILLVLFVSCSSRTKVVGTRMISPEAQGNLWKGSIDLRAQTVSRGNLNFKNSQTKNPIENDGDELEGAIGAEIGSWSKMDIFFLPALRDTPTLTGIKVQLLGDARTKAKKGNFSFSLIGTIGSHHANHSQTRSESDDYISRLVVQHDHEDLGFIAGYRLIDAFVVYGSSSIFHEKLIGNIRTRNGIEDGQFRYTGTGTISAAGAIYYLNSKIQLKLDYSRLSQKWSFTDSKVTHSLNGAFGVHW